MASPEIVTCERCRREIEALTEAVKSKRGYDFCNDCVTALQEKVKAQLFLDLPDRGAVAALEAELHGYALPERELPAGAELERGVRYAGAEMGFAPWTTDYSRGEG